MPKTRTAVGYYHSIKEKDILMNRLRRIEGQARGIARMIGDGRYCIDCVQQLTALSSAADEVALIVLQNHIEGCVANAIREQRGEPYIKELTATVRKAMKR